MQDDIKWDKLLKIRTTGWDASNSDIYHYPYEPTPYCVLERLANSGYINKKPLGEKVVPSKVKNSAGR